MRLLTLVLLAGLVLPALADDSSSGAVVVPEPPPASTRAATPSAWDHIESHKVRLVLLPTSVTDRRGRIVRGLEQESFTVYEERERQEIRVFSSEGREPISIAFLLDVSGSMRQLDKLERAKSAIAYFIDKLDPEDRFALICFADEQVAWITDFTRDRERFKQRLEVQEGYGKTALIDALAAAPHMVDGRLSFRKAIVLITDGIDNSSRLSVATAAELARRVNVPVYTVGFLSTLPSTLPKGAVERKLAGLTRISEETGGKLFAVHRPAELETAVASIESELRFQYLIGYYPKPGGANSGFRPVRLEIRDSGMHVRTRSGYYLSP